MDYVSTLIVDRLKSETFVSAEFLAQMDFTKGGLAETSLELWSQLFNLILHI